MTIIKEKLNKIFGGKFSYIIFLVFYPLISSIALIYLAYNYTDSDFKTVLIGIFNTYIIIETIILSVTFVVFSMILTINRRTRYFFHLRKLNAFGINSAISGYSILGIFLALIFNFLVSFSSPQTHNPSLFIGLFFASFFTIGSILGLFLLTDKIFDVWLNKNVNYNRDKKS